MILSLLKRETRPAHDRIEQNPRLARLLATDLERDEYRMLLGRLYGYHRPLEARLAARPEWEAIGFCFDERRRAGLLRRDLVSLGMTEAEIDALPDCPDLPDAGTFPRALGCLYVLEGSTLGGRIIARHLTQSLGLGAHDGAAFYQGHGDRTGPMWKTFGALLTEVARPPDFEAVVAAADETFTSMDRWLTR